MRTSSTMLERNKRRSTVVLKLMYLFNAVERQELKSEIQHGYIYQW